MYKVVKVTLIWHNKNQFKQQSKHILKSIGLESDANAKQSVEQKWSNDQTETAPLQINKTIKVNRNEWMKISFANKI